MESKINKLTMREILKEIGFPLIKNDFRNTYKFDVDLDLAMEFEANLTKIKDIKDIEEIICEYEEIFDKELYVFHIARLLEQDIDNLKRIELLNNGKMEHLVFTNDVSGKNKRRFFVNAKNLLKTSDVVDIVMKKKTRGEFEIYSSIDLINDNNFDSNNRKTIAEEKLYKIEEKIGLKNVLLYLKNSDLIEICKYSNLATLLIVNQDKFEKKVKKYIQYMDIEKMLILANAIYFYRYEDNLNDISKEDAIKLKKFTKDVSEIIGKNVKTIKTTKFDVPIDFNDIKEKVKNLVSDEEMQLSDINNEKEDKEDEKEIEIDESIEENKKDEIIKNEYIIKFINEKDKTIIDGEKLKDTIFKIDINASQQKLDDETNCFYLPNNRCYILQGERKSVYGNATYVIEKDLFENKKEKIIKNNKVDFKELEIIRTNNFNGVVKLVHTGWENSLELFFDMKNGDCYTKEENENIKKIVYEVKK